jgi:acyl-coenzyme A synthetase/AMP-(fatty) acid ligase
MRDEQIIAFVTLLPGADVTPAQLRDWCVERLAPFRVPEHVVIERELPRTAVGKIQKHELRAAWTQHRA